MPTRNYMVVHARRDHSFRVPRPDLSDSLGTPNACTQCHKGKSNQWAAEAALRWWGSRVRAEPHYGETIRAAQQEQAGAASGLERLIGDPARPAIRRATAASLLARNAGPGAAASIQRGLSDADPMVRLGALSAAEAIEPRARLALLSTLLRDPIRTVRIDAARALTAVPRELIGSAGRADFEAALAEYIASQNVDADRAESHLNLAGVFVDQGELDRAEAEYETALELSPALGGAYVNLADLYRQRGRDDKAERVLRRGVAAAPRDPGVRHALGLTLVRQKRMREALKELELAATLPPDRPHYVYVYAVALDSEGQAQRALRVLAGAHRRHPGNREILYALVTFSAKAGDRPSAVTYAKRLLALDPQDPDALRLLRGLSGAASPEAR
jgi:tetratricopeptide (TPR) repeat protein